VNEGGELEFHLWSGALTFDAATVDTVEGDQVRLSENKNSRVILQINDSNAYNSTGYDLQVTATQLTADDTHFIDNENLTVQYATTNKASSCLGNSAPPVEGGNAYQTVTLGPSTVTPLSGAVQLAKADAGRGCGYFLASYTWLLNVPAGTYTGGGNAVYNGSITVSNVAGVGEN